MIASLIGQIAASRRRTAPPSGITQDALTANASSTSSPSFSHSQGSLTNGYAIVIFQYYWYSGVTLSSPTYGGVALTLLGSIQAKDGFYTAIYGLALGTSGAGSKTVAATLSTHYNCWTTVITFNGVHQTNSFTTGGGVNYASGPPVAPSIATTSTNELCIGAIVFTASTAITSSQTTIAGVANRTDVSKAEGTGGSVTFSWSWPSGSRSYARSMVVLQPS